MTLNWRREEYFESLLAQPEETEAHTALELLVDDIHKDKAKTINAFLAHYGSEDFMWGIVRLLALDIARVAGNAAYIFGTLAENDLGQVRVMSLINGSSPHSILPNLTEMLSYEDTECVMNAAGTLGTLAESKEGREWMLHDSSLDSMLRKVTSLLSSTNMWTASNAALVLARLSISEEGCKRILNHYSSLQILTKLVESLGMDEAGRGMNAAFAIGRLCDIDDGRHRLLNHRDSDKMLNSLCCMLSSKDSGCGKNACYALSCLASSDQGHKRLLLHTSSDLMLHLLAQQLSNDDGETAWFAAMTLRTLASKRQGVLRLRDHADVVPILKQIILKPGLNPDLLEEVDLTLELLKHLARPDPPRLEVKGPHDIEVTWPVVELKSGLPVTYSLFCEGKPVYEGPETAQLVSHLRPFTKYSFTLQIHTEGDDSPTSNQALAKTEDAPPDAPEALRILGVTTSQLRLGWAPPQYNNGGLKGYIVYNGKHQVENTSELNAIVSGLAPSTSYDIFVCAYNHKGKGPKSSITASTEELGKHAPTKLTLTARGRSQIHVTWNPPENPLGRLYRFEVTVNGKVGYSGTGTSYTAKQLTPNTEYSFTVIAVTSEGRCETDPVKKKTNKDEYNVQSTAPVFFSHPTKVSLEPKPNGKSKEKSHSRSPSRNSKKKDQSSQAKSHRSTSSPVSMESSLSRPVSAVSRASSAKHKKKSLGSARQRADNRQAKVDARKNQHIEALRQMERDQKSSAGEDSSGWSDDDRWPGQEYMQATGSSLANVRRKTGGSLKKGRPEFMSVTVTYKEGADGDESLTEKSGSAESQDRKKQRKVPQKDVTFDDRVHAENRLSHVTLGLPRDGALDDNPSDIVDKRGLMRMSNVKRNHTAPNFEKDGLKYPGDIPSYPLQRPGRLHYNGTQETHTKKRQLESLGHDIRFNPAVAIHDLRLNDHDSPGVTGAGDAKDFSLFANGHMIYQEKPDSADRYLSPPRTARRSESEDVREVEELPDKLTGRSPREMGSLRGSWNDEERFGVSDSDGEPGEDEDKDRMASLVPGQADDNISNRGGGQSLSAISRSLKRDILARNPLMDHALPSRSVLADHGSFYQRTNTFISSHRPTLKKNLARLVAPSSHTTPPQTASQVTYDPDFPTTNNNKKGGGANKYNFIPTQFRTQPVNLPTPLLPRGNTLASLQDRSAYVRKLEALSQSSSNDGGRAPSHCNDCGRDQDQKPSLRYSHRHDPSVSFQLNSSKLRTGHGEMLSFSGAR